MDTCKDALSQTIKELFSFDPLLLDRLLYDDYEAKDWLPIEYLYTKFYLIEFWKFKAKNFTENIISGSFPANSMRFIQKALGKIAMVCNEGNGKFNQLLISNSFPKTVTTFLSDTRLSNQTFFFKVVYRASCAFL